LPAYTAGDIQSGSPEDGANPATCQDRQGAFAQSRADVAARHGNEGPPSDARRPGVFFEETPMTKQPARTDLPSFSRFEGFPYLVTRVVPALYHVILLPTSLAEPELRSLARQQVLSNRLDTCLVLGGDRAVYFDPSGDSKDTDSAPAGGSVLTGQLLPPIAFTEPEEMSERRERLEAFATSRARLGILMGDPAKGGRVATDEELRRLAGAEPDGHPVGLERCPWCHTFRGACLDPSVNFRGQLMNVHCVCENHNHCARCGEHLYEHRLNANYYNPSDRRIWHVPGFCGLSHRCDRSTACPP
jgi:hypothetical protein